MRTEYGVSEEAIHCKLALLIASPVFAQSNRFARLIRFTVETTLGGRADSQKEYCIGTAVYDRKAPCHAASDSIVRTEARRPSYKKELSLLPP